MSTVRGRHLVIVGPTASGKSELAIAVAHRLVRRRRNQVPPATELLSADSMAVYRGMDIGTATPTPDQRARARHHLVDLVDPHEEFSVARYRRDAVEVLDGLERRGATGIVVGGTGLYVQAVVDDLDLPGRYPDVFTELELEPDTAALHRRLVALDATAAGRIDPANRRRTLRALEVTLGSGRRFSDHGPGLTSHPPTPFLLVGVRPPRDQLEPRIRARLREQLARGWVDEVERLRSRPQGWSRTASRALGYPELSAHLDGTLTLTEATEAIVVRTRQFAVRQLRWFGRDPRITWFDAGPSSDELAERVVAHWDDSTGT